MKLTFWEVAEAVKATNNWKQWPDFEITGVEFDSRLIQNNQLFVPLKGENDGHSFIQSAIDKGAVAAFWSIATEAPTALPILQVADTLAAFQKLASYYLTKIHPTVIAITGSNGKTTTKDMTEAVLAQQFKTYKTQGNYNNNIGLPYTILHMPAETEKLVLEMGMDHAGELTFLSQLAQPTVAAITMIGEAHIENLGSRQAIARAKMEITAGLAKNGLLVIPADEPLVTPFTQNLTQTVKTVGKAPADYQVKKIKTEKRTTTFTIQGVESVFTIPVPGEYNVSNALIAYSIGKWFGLSDRQVHAGLATVSLTKNRTEWVKTPAGTELLSDVYNANPTAMKLVLDSFSQMATSGKRVAILGDMLELGSDSAAMHRSVAAHLQPEKIADVFLYGAEMQALYEELQTIYAKDHVFYYVKEDKSAMITKVKTLVAPNDIVVLKGSNGMGLNEVVTELLEK